MSVIVPRKQSLLTPRAPSLRAAAAAKGILYGSTLTGYGSLGTDRYGELFAKEIGQFTVEFQSGFDNLQPTENTFDFTVVDPVISYAKGLGVPLNFGNLISHGSNIPGWLTTKLGSTPDDWDAEIDNHLSNVMTHTDTGIDYAADISDWMVVNEAFLESDANGVFRENIWYTSAANSGNGYDYIPYAFEQAAVYAPAGRLILNQNQLDVVTAATRQANMLTWLETWLAASVPIHAVGMQSHVQYNSQFVEADLRSFIRNVHSLGLDCIITEFDGRASGSGSDWVQLQEIAEYSKRYLDVCLEEGISEITSWGLVGDHWWLSGSSAVSGVFYGDAPYRETPLRFATVQAIQDRPWHPVDLPGVYEIWDMGLCRGTWRAATAAITRSGLLPEALVTIQADAAADTYFLTSITGLVSGSALAQGTDSRQPQHLTLVNGLPTATFDGSDDRLTAPDPNLSLPTSLFVVGQLLTVGGSDRRIISGASSGTRVRLENNGTTTNYAYNSGTTVDSGVNGDTTSPHVFVVVYNGASSSLSIDGVQVSTGDAGNTSPMTTLTLCGNPAGGNNAHLQWIACGVVNGVISAADIAGLQSYYSRVWGIGT